MSERIYATNGEFLHFAAFTGKAECGLEETIRIYEENGRFDIDFSRPFRTKNDRMVIGILEEPFAASITISLNSISPFFRVNGTSYGPGILRVLTDYIKKTGITTIEDEGAASFIKMSSHLAPKYEKKLLEAGNPDFKAQYLLQIREAMEDYLRRFPDVLRN